MDNLALEKLINQSNFLLAQAQDELNKPKHEMVAFAACQTAKLSIFKLLQAYLEKHKIAYSTKDNLVQLYEKCKVHTSKFEQINIQEMDCVHGLHCDMEKYCMEPGFVSACVFRARAIQVLLYQD